MNDLRFDYPDGRVEVLPAGRYTDSEWLGLSMRATARHQEAMAKAGYP